MAKEKDKRIMERERDRDGASQCQRSLLGISRLKRWEEGEITEGASNG